MFDIVATIKKESYYNADWQSITDGVGGYGAGTDLQSALIDYLRDSGSHEEADQVQSATESNGMIKTTQWAYMFREQDV